jgi:undecaprenyl-diphosphatase
MVLIPILGANFLDALHGSAGSDTQLLPLIIGFATAFVSGLLACKWMIRLVSSGKLIYFALYCLFIGLIAIFAA